MVSTWGMQKNENNIGTSKHTDDDDDEDEDEDDEDEDDEDDEDDDNDDDDDDGYLWFYLWNWPWSNSSANVAIYIIYVYIATEEVATLLTNLCHNVVSWSVMLRQKHGICWRKMNLTRAVQKMG